SSAPRELFPVNARLPVDPRGSGVPLSVLTCLAAAVATLPGGPGLSPGGGFPGGFVGGGAEVEVFRGVVVVVVVAGRANSWKLRLFVNSIRLRRLVGPHSGPFPRKVSGVRTQLRIFEPLNNP